MEYRLPWLSPTLIAVGTSPCSHSIVVENHGGSLECVSSEREGTTFVIKIPRHQPKSEADGAAHHTPDASVLA
ncbi:MAG: hypothetical protein AAF651_00570 [Cyanobacteria bacterium P01_C01_bin.73]